MAQARPAPLAATTIVPPGRSEALRRGRPPARRRSGCATQRVGLPELLARLGSGLDALVLGGGCAGLALATAVVENGGSVAVVESRRGDRDGRTWCYWDTGDATVPEAVSMSWDRWEIRTATGSVVASDPGHPYRMVRASDYRAAARRRIEAGGSRIVDGTTVAGASAGTGPEATARLAPRIVDARGGGAPAPVPPGRVALYQRFVGRWIRTARPVFDPSTVTLMDFADRAPGEDVLFFYVLPVAPDLAMVECTVFARSVTDHPDFRGAISAYLRRRWGLQPDDWTEEGEEAGCIPMTDAPTAPSDGAVIALGLRAGIARPSTGYAFTRIQVAARRAATAIRAGSTPAATRDRLRTRVLDAIFLRFLRDRPEAAPAVFLRMFDRLPGPLTVRFLTERSSVLDDLRLILALPKAPFLRAAASTALERLGAVAR